MSEVKVAFGTPVVPGDEVVWHSRRGGWKKGKIRRTAIVQEMGYKYDYSQTPYKAVPTVKSKTKITVEKGPRSYGVITFTRVNSLLKVGAGGVEIKV